MHLEESPYRESPISERLISYEDRTRFGDLNDIMTRASRDYHISRILLTRRRLLRPFLSGTIRLGNRCVLGLRTEIKAGHFSVIANI